MLFLQSDELPQAIFTIKTGAFIAGLIGAFVTLLRKSEGSLQARLIGLVIAIFTILYIVPVVGFLVEWKFAFLFNQSIENLTSFVLGLFSQTIVETFADNPAQAVLGWSRGFYKMKRVIFNGEQFTDAPNIRVTPQDTQPETTPDACEKEKE